jgi:8-oxo-dGTP pyrophosphatase MutT (NUDIX family)
VATLLSEDKIAARLRRAYRPGVIASTDGYAKMYTGVSLTCAAVLVPLVCREDGWHLLFIRRAESVEHHKGQVAFPGGACDPSDSGAEATALREAEEEIGLRAQDVHLLGRLNDIVTITRYRVTPVVGVVPWPYAFRPAPNEVARLFTIPLDFLTRRENRSEQPLTPRGEARPFPVVIFRSYEGEVLWGASARIVLNFLEVLGL